MGQHTSTTEVTFRAFGEELAKYASNGKPTPAPGAAKFVYDPPQIPSTPYVYPPHPGGGPTLGGYAETMSKQKWKQTAVDLSLIGLVQGLGWGISRTVADRIAEKTRDQSLARGVRPGWLRKVPIAASLASSLGAYALARIHDDLRERRAEAERTGKVVLR